MQFDYQVPIEEYAAGQVLNAKARSRGVFVQQALLWISLGIFFVLLVGFRSSPDWVGILFLIIATGLFFLGIRCLFPASYFRRLYPKSGLEGKTYHADVDNQGFLVTGDGCTWRITWPEVRAKREDKLVFIFTAKGTIFIFGKRYLSNDQQTQIRQLAAMS